MLTKGVIAVTGVAFLVEWFLLHRIEPGPAQIPTWLPLDTQLAMVRSRAFVRLGAGVGVLVEHGEVWRLVTPMLLHGGWIHILFNMFALFQLGPLVEQAFGRSRFLVLYLVSGIAGSLASTMFQPPFQSGVGASGAICGLLGIMAVWGFRRGGMLGQIVRRQMIQWAVIILVWGLLMPNIDNAAHAGGFVGGAALAFLISPAGFRRETALRRRLWNAGAAVVVLVAAACVVMAVMNFVQTAPAR
jgi:rhomboid protease GluP